MIKYEKTKDPNIIKQIETIESEILINKLEKQIIDLEIQIANAPQLIEKGKYPQEVLALIDEYNSMIDITDIQEELDRKRNLLNLLNELESL